MVRVRQALPRLLDEMILVTLYYNWLMSNPHKIGYVGSSPTGATSIISSTLEKGSLVLKVAQEFVRLKAGDRYPHGPPFIFIGCV